MHRLTPGERGLWPHSRDRPEILLIRSSPDQVPQGRTRARLERRPVGNVTARGGVTATRSPLLETRLESNRRGFIGGEALAQEPRHQAARINSTSSEKGLAEHAEPLVQEQIDDRWEDAPETGSQHFEAPALTDQNAWEAQGRRCRTGTIQISLVASGTAPAASGPLRPSGEARAVTFGAVTSASTASLPLWPPAPPVLLVQRVAVARLPSQQLSVRRSQLTAPNLDRQVDGPLKRRLSTEIRRDRCSPVQTSFRSIADPTVATRNSAGLSIPVRRWLPPSFNSEGAGDQ